MLLCISDIAQCSRDYAKLSAPPDADWKKMKRLQNKKWIVNTARHNLLFWTWFICIWKKVVWQTAVSTIAALRRRAEGSLIFGDKSEKQPWMQNVIIFVIKQILWIWGSNFWSGHSVPVFSLSFVWSGRIILHGFGLQKGVGGTPKAIFFVLKGGRGAKTLLRKLVFLEIWSRRGQVHILFTDQFLEVEIDCFSLGFVAQIGVGVLNILASIYFVSLCWNSLADIHENEPPFVTLDLFYGQVLSNYVDTMTHSSINGLFLYRGTKQQVKLNSKNFKEV